MGNGIRAESCAKIVDAVRDFGDDDVRGVVTPSAYEKLSSV